MTAPWRRGRHEDTVSPSRLWQASHKSLTFGKLTSPSTLMHLTQCEPWFIEWSGFLQSRWPTSKRNYDLWVNICPEPGLEDHKTHFPVHEAGRKRSVHRIFISNWPQISMTDNWSGREMKTSPTQKTFVFYERQNPCSQTRGEFTCISTFLKVGPPALVNQRKHHLSAYPNWMHDTLLLSGLHLDR